MREIGGLARNRTGVQGFAVLCVTTPPRGLDPQALRSDLLTEGQRTDKRLSSKSAPTAFLTFGSAGAPLFASRPPHRDATAQTTNNGDVVGEHHKPDRHHPVSEHRQETEEKAEQHQERANGDAQRARVRQRDASPEDRYAGPGRCSPASRFTVAQHIHVLVDFSFCHGRSTPAAPGRLRSRQVDMMAPDRDYEGEFASRTEKRAWQSGNRFAIGTPLRASALFPGSSAVEQPAVNRLVAGSNPARGAILFDKIIGCAGMVPRQLAADFGTPKPAWPYKPCYRRLARDGQMPPKSEHRRPAKPLNGGCLDPFSRRFAPRRHRVGTHRPPNASLTPAA